MINAKNELMGELEDAGKPEILCAAIECRGRSFDLGIGHSKEDSDRFMDSLDFIYNNGFGGQELDGTIWLKDGRWIDRAEYDGSEWWVLREAPQIPDRFL
jgi:hypothetical protein